MGMTMTQKILAKHAGLDTVEVGQLIEARVDMVLGNDITTPVAITEFEKAGFIKNGNGLSADIFSSVSLSSGSDGGTDKTDTDPQ